jgi:hypothetical protein
LKLTFQSGQCLKRSLEKLMISGSHRILLACVESLVRLERVSILDHGLFFSTIPTVCCLTLTVLPRPEYSLNKRGPPLFGVRASSERKTSPRITRTTLRLHRRKRSLCPHDAVHSPGMSNRILDNSRSKICQPKYSFLVGLRLPHSRELYDRAQDVLLQDGANVNHRLVDLVSIVHTLMTQLQVPRP